MYIVYLLSCSDGSLYAGLTTDPDRRLREHNAGGPKGARYTRARRPVELVWQSEPLPDRSTAAALEWRLKQMTRRQKLHWIQQHGEQQAIRGS
ncbi:MAG: endonuclease [Candidatus Melainabacteria bacterium HGW-Melainabacteria-1]|nr:MAG: endonuclease [Candidatus Melainabacteria bacterium HGW-Melainabacteria-1]